MSRHRLAIVVSHPIQHFVHLYRALAQRHDLDLLVLFGSNKGVRSYHDREMRTEIAWAGDLTAGYPHHFLQDRHDLGGRLRAFRPHAVLIYGHVQRLPLLTLGWAKRHRVPVLMTGDGDAVTERAPFKALLRKAVLRPVLSQVSIFLTPGDQNEVMLAALGVPPDRTVRTPFPIDEHAYCRPEQERRADRARIRDEFVIASDAVVALFVGKLSPRKRPRDLLEAYRQLDRQEMAENLHLLFCGDGSERDALQEAIDRAGLRATVAGFVNVDRLPAFYPAADFLVHPSQHDPHPLACSEAAASALPLILSDRVGLIGPTDIGQEGRNAITYPCGDIPKLAEAMRELLHVPEKRAAMGKASQAVFAENDMAKSVAGVMQALDQVARTRAGERSGDRLRRIARKIIAPNSFLYDKAARAAEFTAAARSEGLSGALTLRRLMISPKTGPVAVSLKTLRHPILIRPGTADVTTLYNSALRSEYGRFSPPHAPRLMVDAGAFIGDTSAWFLSRYPGLQVLALEPEEENLTLACRNLAPYGDRVRLLPKALAARSGIVRFTGGSDSGAISDQGASVEAITVADLLSFAPEGRIDILKMDIEGAELAVLTEGAEDWLPSVEMIIAELHGSAITEACIAAMARNGFGYRRHRSLTYFSRSFLS